MAKEYIPYFEKLQDPRWQKKRLEVMEREGFKCQSCLDATASLHVHHCWYEKGVEPWEYPNECYQCLCASCHKQAEALRLEISKLLFVLDVDGLEMVLAALRELERENSGWWVGIGLPEMIQCAGDNAKHLLDAAGAYGKFKPVESDGMTILHLEQPDDRKAPDYADDIPALVTASEGRNSSDDAPVPLAEILGEAIGHA